MFSPLFNQSSLWMCGYKLTLVKHFYSGYFIDCKNEYNLQRPYSLYSTLNIFSKHIKLFSQNLRNFYIKKLAHYATPVICCGGRRCREWSGEMGSMNIQTSCNNSLCVHPWWKLHLKPCLHIYIDPCSLPGLQNPPILSHFNRDDSRILRSQTEVQRNYSK